MKISFWICCCIKIQLIFFWTDFGVLTLYPDHCLIVCVCVLHTSHPIPSSLSLLTVLWHICQTQWMTADKVLLTQLHTLFRFRSFFLNILFLFHDPMQDTASHWVGHNLSTVGFYSDLGSIFKSLVIREDHLWFPFFRCLCWAFGLGWGCHQARGMCWGAILLVFLWKRLCKIGPISPLKLVGNLPEKHSLLG